ncbi:hypothetical protein ACIBUY_24925 [Streptomyces sp. NPDC050085]|uniref:hypothetical protein n=1 Tax=Streptomyces sp. NPDC050085 TaxID=3365600 RepID=UPI0037B474AA
MNASTVQRYAGLGAATTLSLYLGVKVVWVGVGLAGAGPAEARSSPGEWVLLNAVTVVMAAVGVALGLALALPFGRRLPAPAVLFFAWTACGFLGSLVPYGVVLAALGAAGVDLDGGGAHSTDDGDALPAWESALITIGFAGMAIGVALALPLYLRARWPHVFRGEAGRPALVVSLPRLLILTAAALAPAALWLYWSAGGRKGLRPGASDWELSIRLLIGNGALWAVLGTLGAWLLTGRLLRGTPLWLAMTLAFVGSGSLFAWNAWRLACAVLRPGDYEPYQRMPLALAEHTVAVGAGAALLALALRRSRPREAHGCGQDGESASTTRQ